jgi:small neutral amino acid transporter SnatA (MarC family)
MQIIKSILISFCALFIVVDAVGLLPAFANISQDLKPKQKTKTLLTAIYVACGVVIILLVISKVFSWFLGLRPADFKIGGGVFLFILSVYYLLKPQKRTQIDLEQINIFPIAAPLIIGPTLVMMLLILMSSYGLIITTLTFILNMLLLYLIFKNESKIYGTLGDNGVLLISKTANLLLGVFAIMLARQGMFDLFDCLKNCVDKL